MGHIRDRGCQGFKGVKDKELHAVKARKKGRPTTPKTPKNRSQTEGERKKWRGRKPWERRRVTGEGEEEVFRSLTSYRIEGFGKSPAKIKKALVTDSLGKKKNFKEKKR